VLRGQMLHDFDFFLRRRERLNKLLYNAKYTIKKI